VIVDGLYYARHTTDAADRRHLARAVGYLATSRTQEAYALFTAGDGDLDRTAALATLMELRNAEVLAHRHILSPDPRLLLKGDDELVGLVRDIYVTWAEERGWGKLVYAGAIHRNTHVMHAHVLIAGQTGTGRPLTLWPDDYKALKRLASAAERERSAAGKERRRVLRGLVG